MKHFKVGDRVVFIRGPLPSWWPMPSWRTPWKRLQWCWRYRRWTAKLPEYPECGPHLVTEVKTETTLFVPAASQEPKRAKVGHVFFGSSAGSSLALMREIQKREKRKAQRAARKRNRR